MTDERHAPQAAVLQRIVTPLLAVFLLLASSAAADLDTDEQTGLAAAVDRVAPGVVRIETIGGLERVGQVLFGTGPTTGLVVDPAGYILSSAFNFVHKPSSILVRLSDGTRKPAKLVATDHSRMLVLLKIDVEQPLPTCEVAPRKDMRVGQWAVAVGRAFESDQPNRAVGILSALDRVWGKAIQTDAAVSPNNYGGPLVDIRGRVLGLLVPLSPEAADEIAGVEWYDSGIGFAIPMEHIQSILPRLKNGEDLHSGLAGVSLKGPNLYTGEPIIAVCRQKSPAAAAGLKAGDRIVAIDNGPITRAAEVKQEIGRRYAGDKMRVTLLRGKERIEQELQLAAKLPPVEHGFLGILPMRTGEQGGVTVRYVYPGSPAAKAGLEPGDNIVAFQGEPVQDRMDLLPRVGIMEPGSDVDLEVSRSGNARRIKLVLAALPESLPPRELPAGRIDAGASDANRPPVGAVPLKIPEYPNETWAYVPEGYDANVPYGVVVWLHGSGGFDWPQLLARWKPLCDRHDLILVAPKAFDAARWNPAEAALVARLLLDVASRYNVDAARLVVHGYESGGELALVTALRYREVIRGVAVVEASPQAEPPENDVMNRLAMYLASADKSPAARPIELWRAGLRQEKIPVTVKNLGDVSRYLDGEELAELARWIDMLDRI